MPNLMLFVWEDVMRDYTPGLAVVLAGSAEEAIEIMQRDFPEWVSNQLPIASMKVITEPQGFYVQGGG